MPETDIQQWKSRPIFLSYKSEDANLVRLVAEYLIASGLDVWFNEYRILPDDYDRFDQMIDDGLRQATHAVVFTNNRWSRAEWCRYEMDGLLSAISDHRRIVEVGIPHEDEPRETYPALLAQPPIIFQGNPRAPAMREVHRVVAEIAQRFGFPFTLPEPAVGASSSVWLPRFGVSFNPSSFSLWPGRTLRFWSIAVLSPNINLVSAFRTLVFRRMVDGVPISFDVYVWNYESPIHSFSIDEEGVSDDRAVQKSYLRYAQKWISTDRGAFGTVTWKAEGLHLAFVEGRSHFGLTYSSHLGWDRRYAIRIPRDDGEGEGELGFVFSAAASELHTDLRHFCELSPSFDEVVKTASVRLPGRFAAALINLPAFIAKAALAAAAVWVARRSWPVAGALTAAMALFFAAGYFTADLAHWCLRSSYRRVLRTLEPVLWDVLSPANPGRLLLGAPFHAIMWPLIIGWGRIILAAVTAIFQLALPLFLVGWLVVGRPSVITPEWTARRDLVLVISAAAAGVLTNYHAIGFLITRYLKHAPKVDEYL
ncbi:MAG: toll/interleukin-1 receptor domain-containing protein [Acidobacteriota bacterium]|nr:toll/interleukin-1 receptor domain-containing protein [Acidobacteriota bacterium]